MTGNQADNPDHLGTRLARVLSGDAAALNTLLAKLRPYLHYLVREQLASAERYQDHGSDLVQETLVRVYRGLDPSRGMAEVHFHGQSVPQFLNWVGVIVRSVIAQDAKHRKAEKRDPDREVPGSKVFPFLVVGMTSEQKADRDELAIRLTVALEKLPQARQDVLRARFFDGLSFAEISRRTGKSAGALRVLSVRAIGQLRELMEASA
jgi:RNA polymerase sigma-70 factor (ECF subfamily)